MPEFIKSFVGHKRKITGLSQIQSKPMFFLSSSSDKTIRQWNLITNEEINFYTSKSEIKHFKLINDDLYIIEDRTVTLISISNKKKKSIFKSSSTITCIDILSNGNVDDLYLAVGTSEGEVILLHGDKHKKISNFTIDGSPITSLKFFQVGKNSKLAVGTVQGNFSIYEGDKFYFLIKMINTNMGEITAFEWDKRNECTIIVGNNRGFVRSWDFSEQIDNKRIVKINFELKMHIQAITQLTLDLYNNNPILWSSSIDTTLKAWYLYSTPEEIFELRPTNYPVTCFTIIETKHIDEYKQNKKFTRKFLIGSNDHTIKIYEMAILNYFSMIWGLRNAIIEKWESWKIKISENDFPASFNNYLNQYQTHLNSLLKENKNKLYLYTKQLYDHQWNSVINQFDEMLKNLHIRVDNEKEEIFKFLSIFENQISSMKDNFSIFMREKLMSDYSKYLMKISNTYITDFFNSFENNLNNLIKTVTESPQIQQSLDLPLFPDWFFLEINFMLKTKKEEWISDVKQKIEPEIKHLVNLWFQNNRENIKKEINKNEDLLRKDTTNSLKKELQSLLTNRFNNEKSRQLPFKDKIEPVLKNFIKNNNRFIYLQDLSSQLNLFPSIIYEEIKYLKEKKIISGILEKDNKGYFFVNLKTKEFEKKKERLNKKYNSIMNEKQKVKLKNLTEMVTEINKFKEFCHLFNIYSIDEEFDLKKQRIIDQKKILSS